MGFQLLLLPVQQMACRRLLVVVLVQASSSKVMQLHLQQQKVPHGGQPG